MQKINVMHLIDGLGSGGAERMALNFVNTFPRDRFNPILCTSRFDGPLSPYIRSDVTWIRLQRRHRLDLGAIQRLSECLTDLEVDVIHAHSTSLFIALAACIRNPRVAIVWHDHYGPPAGLRRNRLVYGLAARRANAVITVSESLSDWISGSLKVHKCRVHYVPNFVCRADAIAAAGEIPGRDGARIACVASVRPEKDLLNLILAMREVVDEIPDAHLLLIGPVNSTGYFDMVKGAIRNCKLEENISWLGERSDIGAILKTCDIGVLSSASEGFPVVLLEYGLARLGVVSTDVGQCSEVLAGGLAGLVVPPGNSHALSLALRVLLSSEHQRRRMGLLLEERVQRLYSAEPILQQIVDVYAQAIAARRN